MKISVDELAEFIAVNNERYNTRMENRLSCIFVISTNILVISMVMHPNIVLLSVTIIITEIVWKIKSCFIFKKIRV